MSVIGRLVGVLPGRTVARRDEPRVDLGAVFRRVECRVESSGPGDTEGPGAGAIPPVWFEGGTVTAALGAVEIDLHAFSAEPAEVTARIGCGDVTISVPDTWVVELDVRAVGGRASDERGRSAPTGVRDEVVHLVVTGWLVLGRLRVVGRETGTP